MELKSLRFRPSLIGVTIINVKAKEESTCLWKIENSCVTRSGLNRGNFHRYSALSPLIALNRVRSHASLDNRVQECETYLPVSSNKNSYALSASFYHPRYCFMPLPRVTVITFVTDVSRCKHSYSTCRFSLPCSIYLSFDLNFDPLKRVGTEQQRNYVVVETIRVVFLRKNIIEYTKVTRIRLKYLIFYDVAEYFREDCKLLVHVRKLQFR